MYKSLYEYFGKRVGGEIGKQVYDASKKARVIVKTKEISNSKYRGKVMTYPTPWLDSYFTKSDTISISSIDNANIVMSKLDINPCVEISLPTTPEKKKSTLNFY